MNDTAIPRHIAIIMDGNRRWAKKHHLPILTGHKKVADTMLEPLVEHAARRGIKFITFWAFSTENWQRNKQEVEGILRIFRYVVKKRWQRLHEKGVRVKVIGDMTKFPSDLQTALKKVVAETENNQTITAIFALNYGGRDEIVRAVNKATSDKRKAITEKSLANYLDTHNIPDPELIVRTGGEQRLSGFLLWQSEYAELMFVPWYMPEFTSEQLDEVLTEYAKRQRRFGR